jgi:TolB-like protein/DNA-binding winged helix-turn-helix (wHTH) protein/Tfp pilus assembly protein PilF
LMAGERCILFPPFQLDVANEQLRREGEAIPLRPKAFAVLRYLAEHPERLVSREELVEAVWGETKVSEAVLRGCLREVRQALGDSAERPKFIETVPRRGWRFIAPIAAHDRPPPVLSSQLSVVSQSTGKSEGVELATGNWQLTTSVEGQEEVQPLPAAVNGLPQTDRTIDHIPVDTQPQGEAIGAETQAKTGTAPPTTDVQPLAVPFLRRPAGKKSYWQATIIIGGLLLLGGIAAFFYPSLFPIHHEEQPSTLPLPDKPSLVVLPFTNLSNDPAQEYFSDGVTADLTSDLSQIPDLFVTDHNSAFTYKGKAVKAQQIGRELGVRYVVEGSVSKLNGRMRLRVQLIDATTGFHLWSERFDREPQALFALQEEITQKIVATLKLQFPLLQKGWYIRKRTENLEAYDAMLRGIQFALRRTKEANEQARRMFEKAVELDPTYASAYAAIGQTYFTEYLWGWDRRPQVIERAHELAQRALALDDSLPASHSLLSWTSLWKKQPEQAVIEIKRALALDPNNADSYAWQAEVLNTLGKAEEALSSIEHAMRLNPHYPAWYLVEKGWAHRLLWRHEEAISIFKTLLQQEPNYLTAYMHLTICYVQQYGYQLSPDPGTLERALEAAQQINALSAASPWGHRSLAVVYLLQKEYERAILEIERAIALDPTHTPNYIHLADVRSRAGQLAAAQEALDHALRLGDAPNMEVYLATIGVVYYQLGRFEESVTWLERYRARYPHALGAHFHLAAAYAELGRDEEARAEAAEVLRLNPHFSLEVYRQRVPLKDPAMLKQHIAALRKAGLK